ncbi:MAG: hypothetical protein IKC27_07405 [Kiritimatiellae bacterium]|nr:hypothetical protein [Kiritimatiellia bacterium]
MPDCPKKMFKFSLSVVIKILNRIRLRELYSARDFRSELHNGIRNCRSLLDCDFYFVFT